MKFKPLLFLLSVAWAVTGYAQDRLYSDEFPIGDVVLSMCYCCITWVVTQS